MPYSANSELPASIKSSIPSASGQSLFRRVVNSQLSSGKSESVAFASAWAALKNAGYTKQNGVWVKKRQVGDDRFTSVMEAVARSVDLNLGGSIHIHESADGEVFYMPGMTHDAYVASFEEKVYPDQESEPEAEPEPDNRMENVRLVVSALREAGIIKVDRDRKMIWGWASVISEDGEPVVDTQGDIITPDELLKASNDFMTRVRTAKVMHQGDEVGMVVHSLPLIKEISEALELNTNREGWVIGMSVSDDVLAKVESGEFRAFSIGGTGVRTDA